jgi:transposase-like protein
LKTTSNLFKWKHYETDLILLTVRWYLKYSLSYRDIEEMMNERGLHISHTEYNAANLLSLIYMVLKTKESIRYEMLRYQ